MAITRLTKSKILSNPVGIAITGIASFTAVVGLAVAESDPARQPETRQAAIDQSRVPTASPTRHLELHWQPSSEAAGYRVYWGTTPGGYDGVEDVGNVSEAIVSDLDPTKQYHFAVTAYSKDGSESVPTNEVQTP